MLDIAKNFEKTEAWCASNSRDQYYKNNAKDLGEMLFWYSGAKNQHTAVDAMTQMTLLTTLFKAFPFFNPSCIIDTTCKGSHFVA